MARVDSQLRIREANEEFRRAFGRERTTPGGTDVLGYVGDCERDLVLIVEGDGSARRPPDDCSFSRVDAQILEGIAGGASTLVLASTCYLSSRGVEYRVGAMLRRLGVPNRAALVSRAYSLGLFETDAWPPRMRRDRTG